jgi:hypothetical protein
VLMSHVGMAGRGWVVVAGRRLLSSLDEGNAELISCGATSSSASFAPLTVATGRMGLFTLLQTKTSIR